jgi:methylmalonyl-CoA/ethylmalonyl-CoA epimerase
MELMQVAQRVTDLNRAIEFYRDILGGDLLARFDPPGLAFFDVGRVRLLLEADAPSCLLYLRVDDVRTAVEELRGRGIEILGEPHEIFADTEGTFGEPGQVEWMAFFRDSEGNTVGLDSRHPADRA